MIDVSVYVLVKPTEKVDRVTSAIEKIFPGLIMDIREDRIQAYDGIASLTRFHMLLREELILDTARRVMVRGLVGNSVQFRLSKQAAYMGLISFPPEEEPLGSIHVQISGDERIIDWLAPMTQNGEPVGEIDLLKEGGNV
ncbi:MAG TPA: RNA-binding domain-containing protein [Methanotrichaceae archaeon]|nr:RNA-binding domain-containing protein [Methanotrichaceae archaeon]